MCDVMLYMVITDMLQEGPQRWKLPVHRGQRVAVGAAAQPEPVAPRSRCVHVHAATEQPGHASDQTLDTKVLKIVRIS